jgi:hypothetical protein
MAAPFNLVCGMISASGDPTDEAGVANWAPCKIDLDGGSSVVDDIPSECDLGLLSRSASIDDARVASMSASSIAPSSRPSPSSLSSRQVGDEDTALSYYH